MPRRIDLAITLAREAGVKPEWIYSDPWTQQVALAPFSGKLLRRDIGADFMFFFTSPDAPNGGPAGRTIMFRGCFCLTRFMDSAAARVTGQRMDGTILKMPASGIVKCRMRVMQAWISHC